MASRRFRDNPGIQRYPSTPKLWQDWINEVSRWIADQADVLAAKNASTTARGEPGFTTWTSDTAGVFPSGDPTADLELVFYDSTGTSVATREVRGQLNSSAGTITVTDTAVSTSGLTTTPTIVDDGSTSVRVDIVLELGDGSRVSGSLAWNAIDLTVASTTPATGGGK